MALSASSLPATTDRPVRVAAAGRFGDRVLPHRLKEKWHVRIKLIQTCQVGSNPGGVALLRIVHKANNTWQAMLY
eukprot:355355-Chlamydomonas_euryale.AAC.4